jgi:hypothetical protein
MMIIVIIIKKKKYNEASRLFDSRVEQERKL